MAVLNPRVIIACAIPAAVVVVVLGVVWYKRKKSEEQKPNRKIRQVTKHSNTKKLPDNSEQSTEVSLVNNENIVKESQILSDSKKISVHSSASANSSDSEVAQVKITKNQKKLSDKTVLQSNLISSSNITTDPITLSTVAAAAGDTLLNLESKSVSQEPDMRKIHVQPLDNSLSTELSNENTEIDSLTFDKIQSTDTVLKEKSQKQEIDTFESDPHLIASEYSRDAISLPNNDDADSSNSIEHTEAQEEKIEAEKSFEVIEEKPQSPSHPVCEIEEVVSSQKVLDVDMQLNDPVAVEDENVAIHSEYLPGRECSQNTSQEEQLARNETEQLQNEVSSECQLLISDMEKVTSTEDKFNDLSNSDDTRTVIQEPMESATSIQKNLNNLHQSLSTPQNSSHMQRLINTNDSSMSAYGSANQSPSEDMLESPPASNFSDIHSEGSSDSGKGGSDIQMPNADNAPSSIQDFQIFEFELPQELCGRLIGRYGQTVNSIKNKSHTNVCVKRHPFNSRLKLCAIIGSRPDIEVALQLIRKQFPLSKFPAVTLSQVNVPLTSGIPLPESLQLHLPEGIMCDVILSSMVNAGHFFLQQPTHPTYPSLSRLDQCMMGCYMQVGTPELPRPLEAGVICAAPMMGGWYRAQVVIIYDDTDECDVKFVDYGGYSRISITTLRQIRSDFMTLPFQASECFLANVAPLDDDKGWTIEACATFEELAQGQILQAQIVAFSEEGIPYVHLYRVQGVSTTFINRELVNCGMARWIEHQI